MTESESKLFLLNQPLLGCDDLGHDEKAQQIEADMNRKEAHVADSEAAQSGALKRFIMDYKNYKVYTSVADQKILSPCK